MVFILRFFSDSEPQTLNNRARPAFENLRITVDEELLLKKLKPYALCPKCIQRCAFWQYHSLIFNKCLFLFRFVWHPAVRIAVGSAWQILHWPVLLADSKLLCGAHFRFFKNCTRPLMAVIKSSKWANRLSVCTLAVQCIWRWIAAL